VTGLYTKAQENVKHFRTVPHPKAITC